MSSIPSVFNSFRTLFIAMGWWYSPSRLISNVGWLSPRKSRR
jgi:hypothetical protein